MKYACLIYDEPGESTPEERQAMMGEYGAFTRLVLERGVMAGGEQLAPVSSATTVRLRGEERLITDGPFAETKEVLGGFYLLECKDLDEALDYASRIPSAKYGSIEVRPIAGS